MFTVWMREHPIILNLAAIMDAALRYICFFLVLYRARCALIPKSAVQLVDNGYIDVVVGIHPDVEEDDVILQTIQVFP